VLVQFHTLFTSVLDGDEWLVSRPGRFNPGIHWIGGSVGTRAGLDAIAKRKIPYIPLLEFGTWSSSP